MEINHNWQGWNDKFNVVKFRNGLNKILFQITLK